MPKIVGTYKILKTIGKGQFSKVKEVVDINTGKMYSMKIIYLSDINESGKEDEIKRRINILSRMSHPGIINIRSWMHSDSQVFLLFDYVDNSLVKKIAESWPLPEKTARKYFQQLIDILNYMHNHDATFRDLNLENLLIDSRDNVKVSDFIFSNIRNQRLHRESKDHSNSGASYFLRYYVAPEVNNTDGYISPSADIYSAGVILYHMFYGSLPFQGTHPEQLEMNKRNGLSGLPHGFLFEKTTETALKKLIKTMLNPEPHNRPSIIEIKKNQWFKEGYKEIRGNESRHSFVLTYDPTTVVYSAETDKSTVDLNDEINGFELVSRVSPVKLDHAVDSPKTCNVFDLMASIDSPTSFSVAKPVTVTIDLIDNLLKEYKAWIGKTKKERVRKATIPVFSKKYQIQITVSKVEDDFTLIEVDRITGDTPGFFEIFQKIKTDLNKK